MRHGGQVLDKRAVVGIDLMISEVVTVGVAEFGKRFSKVSYQPGQWVLIDMGSIPVRINQAPHVIQVTESMDIWGDNYLEVPEDIDYEETPHHVVGFVLGQADRAGVWTVFNFETGKEEQHTNEKLRAAPSSVAEKLDANPEFSLLSSDKAFPNNLAISIILCGPINKKATKRGSRQVSIH